MKKIVLDSEEEKIERDFANYKPASKEMKARVEKIIEGSRKNRPISLRMNEHDLNILKEKASKTGLPYQTMINVVIHKYVTDRLLDKDEINKYLKIERTSKSSQSTAKGRGWTPLLGPTRTREIS